MKKIKWLLCVLVFNLSVSSLIVSAKASYVSEMLNASENLRYFKEAIFIWTNLPDAQATVIVTYISSAILPLCALLLTSMITNYLEDNNTADTITEPAAEDITDDTVKDNEKENITEEVNKEAEETNVPIEEHEDEIEDKPDEENINESHFINI